MESYCILYYKCKFFSIPTKSLFTAWREVNYHKREIDAAQLEMDRNQPAGPVGGPGERQRAASSANRAAVFGLRSGVDRPATVRNRTKFVDFRQDPLNLGKSKLISAEFG